MPLEIFLLKNGISTKNLWSIAVRDTTRFKVIKHIGRISFSPNTKNYYVNCDLYKYGDYIRKGATVNHKVIDFIPWPMFHDYLESNKQRTIGQPLTKMEDIPPPKEKSKKL